MKFLQKMLFMLMVGVLAWNVDVRGIQFSDPRGGAALPIVNNPHGILVGNCADFAVAGGHHIYFPANGVQPATAHIGQFACANTDAGNINSAVTQWYIEAFGGNAGLTEAYGIGHFAAAGLPQMGDAAVVVVVNAGGGVPLNFAQDFWQEFRAIASTVAGRELLYKILIEIRRIDTAHGNRHCYASGTERVGGMSLTVTHHAGNTAFVNKGSITFDQADAGNLINALQKYYSFLTTLATLPPNTPHFVAENVIAGVPNAIPNDQFTHIQIPTPGGVAANADIYFPIDGHQPTTPNAVAWSCANINNREDSPITNWYMQMFGVLEHSGVFLEVGLDKNNVSKKILSIDGLLIDDLHNELPKKYANQKDAFIKNFRKIASTAVGRTLLYRILIEIRRHDSTVNKFGCVDSDVTAPIAIERRNDCRHLIINWKSSGNSFNFANKVINFGIQFPTRKPTTIGQENDLHQYHEIILYPRPDDVGLLHEMIHWYHFLRHTERFTIERNADNGSIKIDGKKEGDPTIHVHIGNYYWPTATEDKWKLSAMPWFVINGEELAVGFEEIRTILGSHSSAGYINGDDISENLYRSCDNQPLRFGHSGTAFYEDKLVIGKVKSSCDDKRHAYSTIEYDYMANSTDKEDKPRFKYTSTVLKKGIGHFKIQQIGVELIKP